MRTGSKQFSPQPIADDSFGRLVSTLRVASSYVGLAVAVIGALVIAGWAYGIAVLKSLSPIFVSMKADAAVCFILVGLALCMRAGASRLLPALRKYVAALFSTIVIIVGLMVLSEYFFGWDLGIDQLIFREPSGALGTVYPGRIVLSAALSFVLAGLAMFPLIFERFDRYGVPQYLALIGLTISMVAVIGYMYGLREFLGPPNLTPLPLISALTFILLFGGILLADCRYGPMSLLLGRGAGSTMLKITVPSMIVIVIVFGWLRLMVQRYSPIPAELRAGIFTVLDIAVITLATIVIGVILNRLDRRRLQAEQKLSSLNIQLEQDLSKTQRFFSAVLQNAPSPMSVCTPDGHYLLVNRAWEDFNNISAERAVGRNYEELFGPQVAGERRASDREIIDTLSPLMVERTMNTHRGLRYFTVVKFPLLDSRGEVEAIANISADITARKLAEQELSNSYDKLQSSLAKTIQLLATIVEKRDPYTAGHQRRVTDLAVTIAREMGLDPKSVSSISMAGLIHDLGKINVPAELLNKPGKLSSMEMAVVKIHPDTAFDIINVVDLPEPVATIVHQHHERMDGSGYPLGLKGSEILLESRILSVADTVEAMASHRPYRPALGLEKALEEIQQHRGDLYDADVVQACLKVFEGGYKLAEDKAALQRAAEGDAANS